MNEDLKKEYEQLDDYQILDIINNKQSYTLEAYDVACEIYMNRGLHAFETREKIIKEEEAIKHRNKNTAKEFTVGCLSLLIISGAIFLCAYIIAIQFPGYSNIEALYWSGGIVGAALGSFVISRIIKFIVMAIFSEKKLLGAITSFILTSIIVFGFYGIGANIMTILVKYFPFVVLFFVLDIIKLSRKGSSIWKF